MSVRAEIVSALVVSLIAYLLAPLHVAALPAISIFGAEPDLLLLVAAFFLLNTRLESGRAMVWGCGFVKDLFSAGRFGLHALLFGVCAYSIIRTGHSLLRDRWLTRMAAIFVAALTCYSLTALLMKLTHPGFALFGNLWTAVLRSGYTALALPPTFWCLHKFCELTGLSVILGLGRKLV